MRFIKFRHRGSFRHTDRFFKNALAAVSNIGKTHSEVLEKYGQAGVDALASATPTDSGLTAASWSYEIVPTTSGYAIYWSNSNVNKDVNIALILQYGHGTRNGGYVRGIDYINPAIRPVFEDLASAAWKEVTKS